MKFIIAGSRNYSDYQTFKSFVDPILSHHQVSEIVSGYCLNYPGSDRFSKGVDGLGERWAQEHNIKIKPFPANWSLGKSAGPIRNKQMAEYADGLIAFRTKDSRGTNNMIKEAKKQGLKIFIYEIDAAQNSLF